MREYFSTLLVIFMEIGEMIRQVLLERGITVTDFAKTLSCSRENAHRILKKETLDTDLLMKISEVLKYDFFRAISESRHGSFSASNDDNE